MSEKTLEQEEHHDDLPYAPPGAESSDNPEDMVKYAEGLQKELDQANSRADKNWEVALREKADADNVRKRAKQDAENARKFANERILKDLIDVVDSMDQALAQVEDEGVALIQKQFLDVLSKHGVEVINPIEESFNPELHEAMSMMPHETLAPNMVAQVIQKGYQLNGRLVRPARVIVVAGG